MFPKSPRRNLISPPATVVTETPQYHTKEDTHYSCDQTDRRSIHYYRSKLKQAPALMKPIPREAS